jgi:hypothetical protein
VGLEPGLDLHDWETRWQQLQELAADDPEQALPEIVRFVEQMLVERGFDLSNPVDVEGDDPDVVRDFLAAQETARAAQGGAADPGDVAAALENLAEVYGFLVEHRAPP